MGENETVLVDIYKTMLQNESSNHSTFITLIIGLFALMSVATWWFNKWGVSKMIKTEVEEKMEAERLLLIDKLNQSTDSSIEVKIKSYEDRIYKLESNLFKTTALMLSDKKYYYTSLTWWAGFIKLQIKANELTMLRVGVDGLINDIEKLEETEKRNATEVGNEFSDLIKECIVDLVDILEIVEMIPDFLEKEKRIIKTSLNDRKELV